jgi:5-methylthioadenosine/S-adenosylhomocysteine deaminase
MSESMILAGDHLLTMDGSNSVIKDGAVLIQDGRIAAVGRLAEIRATHPSAPVRKIANSVLMPGLVNAHAHSGFLRGTA